MWDPRLDDFGGWLRVKMKLDLKKKGIEDQWNITDNSCLRQFLILFYNSFDDPSEEPWVREQSCRKRRVESPEWMEEPRGYHPNPTVLI